VAEGKKLNVTVQEEAAANELPQVELTTEKSGPLLPVIPTL